MARRKVSRKSVRKVRKMARKVRRTKRVSIKKLVKAEIARNIEDKTAANFINIRNLYSSTSSAANFDANNVFSCAWGAGAVTIVQGTGQGARTGNQVKLKRMTVKGSIHPMAYNATSNPTPVPMYCRMILFRLRNDPTTAPAPIAAGDIFQYGNSSLALQDDLVDQWLSINRDKYAVMKDRKFKLGYSGTTGTGATAGASYFNNNDFKMLHNFSFNVTKHLPKITKFNDNNGTPETANLYCAVWYSSCDGTAIPANRICAAIQYVIEAKYEDA